MSAAGENGAPPAAVRVKEEPEWDETHEIKFEIECEASETAAAGLYAGHEVKRELVLGPERLQAQDIVYSIRESFDRADLGTVKQEPVQAAGSPGDAPRSGDSGRALRALRTCSVRLERLPIHRELHPCTMCHKIFLQKASLTTHLCNHREKETPTNLIKCSKFQILPDNKLYSCDCCGKCFAARVKLVMHRIHTGCKLHCCKVCRKQFSYKSSLARHQLIHKGERAHSYTCKVCKKQFTRLYNLTKHKVIHTGEKPFSCDTCKKRFSLKSYLVRHHLKHIGEKPFSCEICGKQFSHNSQLSQHKLIHTSEKPFSCEICKKRFSLKSYLVRHNLIHSGEKPFSCENCRKCFSQKSHLVQHNLIHTRE